MTEARGSNPAVSNATPRGDLPRPKMPIVRLRFRSGGRRTRRELTAANRLNCASGDRRDRFGVFFDHG